jgi:hypothetical protein
MAQSPKQLIARMEQMVNAWKTLAPNKQFGGMTLEQFEAFAAPVRTAVALIEDLDDQKTRALNERDNALELFFEKAQLYINGVLADPTEGQDSSLYEASGYVRKSERKSGLTTKSKAKKGDDEPPK